MVSADEARTFARCMAVGGVAVFPSDTVYGLGCEPGAPQAVRRLYALKGRRPDKPAAVMFFDLALSLAALPELGPRTEQALRLLLPGALTVLVPNPRSRFPLACAGDTATLGLRVPRLTGRLAALARVRWPILQSSANRAGGPDPKTLADVPAAIRRAADLVVDAGELPGTASTVLDLRRFEEGDEWAVVREGAVSGATIASALR